MNVPGNSNGMDFKDLMKSQMMTMGMMGNMNGNSNGNHNSTGGIMSSGNSMITVIVGMIAMTLMEHFMNLLKEIGKFLKEYIISRYERKKEEYKDVLINNDAHKHASSIFFEVTDKNTHLDSIKSVLDYICEQNSAINLRFDLFYTVVNKEEFSLNYKDVKCKIVESVMDEGKIKNLLFRIYSNTLNLKDLKKWLKEINDLYVTEKQNRLGDKKFFFNEIPEQIVKLHDGSVNVSNLPKKLTFSMTEFRTNKRLDNIFGPEIVPVKKMVDLFSNNPEWYVKRGIPHTLGLLLYGPPGTGKSSTIKAIAKDTERHIFNIALRPTTTQTQLNNLFFSDTIQVELECGNRTVYKIPLDKRIYVLEDVDCLTDVVLSRTLKDEKEAKKEQEQELDNDDKNNNNAKLYGLINGNSSSFNPVDSNDPFGKSVSSGSRDLGKSNKNSGIVKGSKEDDPNNVNFINLSFILNLLDGILETPNRLLIMTSNHPEKLDSALIRPGRIDLMIEFGHCKVSTIIEMFHSFFDMDPKETKYVFKEELSDKLSPASLSKILGINYNDSDKAYLEILETVRKVKKENELKLIEEKKEREKQLKLINEEKEIQKNYLIHKQKFKKIVKMLNNKEFEKKFKIVCETVLDKCSGKEELELELETQNSDNLLETIMKNSMNPPIEDRKDLLETIMKNSLNQTIDIPNM